MSKKKKGKYPKGLNPVNPGYLLDPKSSSPRGRDQLLGLLGRTRVAEVIGSYSVVIANSNTASSAPNDLNSGGFRKIDSDKWEFFNEAFQRGNRHLLNNIQRRRPPQSQQVGTYIRPPSDATKAGLEFDIEKLRNERSFLMQEVVELKQQQRTTLQRARQEQRDIGSSKVRRIVKQHQGQTGISDSLNEGQIVRYQPDWRNISISSQVLEVYPVSLEESPKYLSQALARELSEGVENLTSDELAIVHEIVPAADTIGLKSSSFRLVDTLFKGKNVTSSNQEVLADEFVSFAKDLTNEAEFPEFSPLGTEDKWNTSFNISGAPSSSDNEPWGNPINYEVPEFGVTTGMSDKWDISSLVNNKKK
ncbi:heat stress transcription factor A-3 [Cajanus cajan]|uniref:heat stress transcription factor A-3 n=1 Tax=Cajanus cajan TaxID=3821 RepID=UPI00098D7A6C|nr:heat stress transcription factor A-3 [Cajanus cajan]